MPRTARCKSDNAIYHIMVRSISEINLFENDQDKDEYISIIKKYKPFKPLHANILAKTAKETAKIIVKKFYLLYL